MSNGNGNNRHTPGPWKKFCIRSERPFLARVESDGNSATLKRICTICVSPDVLTPEHDDVLFPERLEAEANMRIIQQAPELYQALVIVRNMLMSLKEPPPREVGTALSVLAAYINESERGV